MTSYFVIAASGRTLWKAWGKIALTAVRHPILLVKAYFSTVKAFTPAPEPKVFRLAHVWKHGR